MRAKKCTKKCTHSHAHSGAALHNKFTAIATLHLSGFHELGSATGLVTITSVVKLPYQGRALDHDAGEGLLRRLITE